jgi:hypothetical protein
MWREEKGRAVPVLVSLFKYYERRILCIHLKYGWRLGLYFHKEHNIAEGRVMLIY